jgi:asparagine synthase (glutamine-hydrolysing)
MAETLAHRGPDGQGAEAFRWGPGAPECEPSVAFGHRRLAILDLSERAAQPMVRGAVAVTYNGEIYNYIELREELKGLGHAFSTESDTEVLLEAYREWGLDFLGRLNGIFAFVLHDGERGRCFAVRDRLGVKPLFWTRVGEVLHIASEIRALQLALPGAELEEALAYDFLLNGRLDHSEQTFFRGVSRLPAGHYLQVEAGKTTVGRYWEARATDTRHGRSFEENAEEFGALLRDAVRLQLRSDVPVGCCLSGGLDSSSVVSLASSLTETPISVFTARYRNPEIDEWNWASAVHAEKRVRPVAIFAEPEAYWEHLDEVVASQEEPFGGPAVYAQWRLMKEVRANGVKVVLNGQGGDELLCGYAKYFYFRVADLVRSGKWLGAIGAGALLALGGERQHFNFEGAQRYLPGVWWSKKSSASLLHPGFAARWKGRSVKHPRGSVVDQQIIDLTRYGLPTLLRYEDRNSMAHSPSPRSTRYAGSEASSSCARPCGASCRR